MSPARWEPPDMGTPRHCSPEASFRGKRKKRKSLCLEKFGMPDEMNATGLKMSVDTEQNEKSEYVYVRR